MARVTGIGGVFLRARDPVALADWYSRHLGIPVAAEGQAVLSWADEIPVGTGMTIWSTFPADSLYIGRPAQQSMINYRVDNLDGMVDRLRAAGAAVDMHREDHSYGRFAWATDPEGNRFELWEPFYPDGVLEP